MKSAFGVTHMVSKRGVPNAGLLPGMLKPYKGALPKPPTTKQLDPSYRPKTMALRDARRKAASDITGRPGEAMK